MTPRVDADWLRHINHAWTSTVHRAQGRTTDTVIAVLDVDSMMTDRALLYVEMSRARDSFILLTDDREQLAHRLEQDTGVSHSALEATGQSLDVRPFHQLGDKEPLRPVLQEWRTLEGIAEHQGVTPFQLPEAKPLLARVYRRVTCEGIHAPPAITHIVTAHQTYQATRHRKEVQALEQAWASLQTQASTNGQSIAQEPGVGALLTRNGEIASASCPSLVITGVQACRDRLQTLSDRLEQCGKVIHHDNQQRIKAKDRITFDWIEQRIKATTRQRDIAFLPATPELVARTQAFIARYPDTWTQCVSNGPRTAPLFNISGHDLSRWHKP